VRKVCLLIVTLGALGLADSAAAAPPLTMPLTFNNAVLTTPGFPNTVLVTPASTPVTATATLVPGTGAFTIKPSDFNFPTYSFTTPLPGSFQITLKNPATGQFNAATGALSITADFVATVNLNGVGSCSADAGTQTYSTSSSAVYPGVAFPANANGATTGPGAITGGWQSIQSSGSACSLVASALNGPGGLWLSKDIAPPKPKLSISAAHKAKGTVGKSTTLKVTVANRGKLVGTSIKVCAKAPKSVHVAGAKCKTIAQLAVGAKKTLKFKLKPTKAGSFTVKFKASESGISSAKTKVALKVA